MVGLAVVEGVGPGVFRMRWVLRRMGGVIGRNAWTLITLNAFFVVGTSCADRLLDALSFGSGATEVDVERALLSVRGILTLSAGLLVETFIATVLTTAVMLVTFGDLKEQRLRAVPALTLGWRSAPPLFTVMLAASFGVMLGTMLVIIPGILLALRWAVALPARLGEGLSLGDALRRSDELTNEYGRPLLGLGFLFVVGTPALSTGIELVAGRLGLVSPRILVLVSTEAFGTLANTVLSAGLAVCYAGLRVAHGEVPAPPATVTIPPRPVAA